MARGYPAGVSTQVRSGLATRLGDDAEDLVDLVVRQVVVRLAGRDDQVRGQLHLAEQVGVLEGHVELVVHLTTPRAHTGSASLLTPRVPDGHEHQTPRPKSDPDGPCGTPQMVGRSYPDG